MTSAWPFTGRTGDLDRIRQTVLGAAEPAAIVVRGAAGVGRSRLLGRAVAGLDAEQWAVFETRAAQQPTAAFGGLAHLLPAGLPAEDPARAARALLVTAAGRRVLVVADDLHVLDPPTVAVVRELVGSGHARLLASVPNGRAIPVADLEPPVLALAPLSGDELAELLAVVLASPVEPGAAAALHAVAGGDLAFVGALLSAGLATGALLRGPEGFRWYGELRVPDGLAELLAGRALPEPAELEVAGPFGVEVALAAATVLAAAPRTADAVLRQAAPDTDRARAVHAAARAAVLAWGLGAADEADRLLAGTAAALTDPAAEQRVRLQQAAADLHRARCRDALDGAADARELTPPAAAAREVAPPGADAGEAASPGGGADEAALPVAEIREAAFPAADVREVASPGGGGRPSVSMSPATDAESGAGGGSVVGGVSGAAGRSERGGVVGAEGGSVVGGRGGPVDGAEVGAGIGAVEALAAALTGQGTAAVQTAERALANEDAWVVAAPGVAVTLEFARCSAWLSAGGLDVAEERTRAAWEADPVAHAAVRGRLLRERGRAHEALAVGREGARLLAFGGSLFAGPCLAELAQAAVLTGDLPAAHHALAQAERRAIPTLRALWFPVALARPWVLAAQGAVGAAVHDLLDAAAAAEGLDLRAYAMTALHDVVRLGAAGVVADRLARLAEEVDGELAPLFARHAAAAAAGSAAELAAVSADLEALGMPVLAAEASAQAAEAHWDKQAAAAAGSRAWVLAQRCGRVRTPALARAQPDLTLVQYEIAEQVAAGRSDREIAVWMEISPGTVADQVAAALLRLGIPDRGELAALFAP